MKNGTFIGLDIGASHIKITTIDKELNPNTQCYPLWEVSLKGRINRMSLIKATVRNLIRQLLEEHGKVYINIVSSIEALYPSFDYLGFFRELSRDLSVDIYTINKKFKVVHISELDYWNNISVFHALGYIASKLINTGMLIHMNSSSTMFVPVISGKPVSQEIHYSTGTGMWLGALYTSIHAVDNRSIIFGKKCIISPSSAMILDILLERYGESIENILSEYNSPIQITDEYKEKSLYRLLELFGIFPEREYKNPSRDTSYNTENQIKISSLYLYHRLLDILFENVVMLLSELDIPLSDSEFVLSGIGRRIILSNALYLFKNEISYIDYYIPKPYCTFLESFSAALSLYEHINSSKITLDTIWLGDK